MASLKELRKIKRDALVIIAHPDDESIFAGGTIAGFKKWRWRILCVTDCDERYNKIRRKELLRACRIYRKYGSKVEPFMLGIVKKKGRFSRAEIVNKIKDYLRKSKYPDLVFTHNRTGEYGHKTHKLIHDTVKEIGFRNIYTFSDDIPNSRYCKKIESVRLSHRSFAVKKRIVSLYAKGSQRSNFSRLRQVVDKALNFRVEAFHKHY